MQRRRAFLGLLVGGYLFGDRWGTLSGGDGASAQPPGGRIPKGSFSFEPAVAEPIETLTAGDPDADRDPYYTGQHRSLWNDRSTCSFGLVITGLEHGTVLDWQGELGTGEYVTAEFQQADQYLVTLHVDTVDDSWYWLGIDRSWFDCNSSSTTVVVRPGGRVERGGSSTLINCPRPRQYRAPKPGDFDPA
ncbi:hypothetical protein ACOZ4N_03290 [Halorientalis pallida]|uniref:hypothetical protein n=1 Tax=Halorientalis pallida TaxID=2479928 RepID=UPI003C701B7E